MPHIQAEERMETGASFAFATGNPEAVRQTLKMVENVSELQKTKALIEANK